MKSDMFKYDVKPPPLLDFSATAADSNWYYTSIAIQMGYEQSEWMRLGSFQLVPRDSRHFRGIWLFEALLADATDYDHSPARLIRMELTGVNMHMHLYGVTHIDGFIHGDVENFRVPEADYDPRFHPEATHCKEKSCSKHVIVPEGFYVPPVNEALHKVVAGRRIDIRTGAKSPSALGATK